MAKSLADMSVEEREECKGMWAEFRSTRGIILGYEAGYVRLLSPNRVGGDREVISHTHIGLTQLLPDLPRAWTPDGEPAASCAAAYHHQKYANNPTRPCGDFLLPLTPENATTNTRIPKPNPSD